MVQISDSHEDKHLYPSLEILYNIPENDTENLAQAFAGPLQLDQNRDERMTFSNSILPDVELPNASSRQPYFMQCPQHMINASYRHTLEQNSSHCRSPSKNPQRSNSRQSMKSTEFDNVSLERTSSHHKSSIFERYVIAFV